MKLIDIAEKAATCVVGAIFFLIGCGFLYLLATRILFGTPVAQ